MYLMVSLDSRENLFLFLVDVAEREPLQSEGVRDMLGSLDAESVGTSTECP